MAGWIKHFIKRWQEWSGDSQMEAEIREHLNGRGCFDRTAKITGVRLVAVQRPGWLQVFRFEATARLKQAVDEDGPDPEAVYVDLFGLVREDMRKDLCEIQTFDNEEARKELFVQWSEELIRLRGARGLA